jgi:phytoene synthase
LTPDAVSESYAYCQALARSAARNFYYSFLPLPRERFRAMCVLYAVFRVSDDLADSDSPVEERAAALARWRAELLEAASGGAAAHPVLPALADVISRYSIPHARLIEVIEGVEMDLRPIEFNTFADLARYCYHVAGAVGLACIQVWGYHDERALGAAVDCGTAFQLTNILRDLREDALRGRVYLPREELARFELTAADLACGAVDDRFTRMMQFEVERACGFYTRARALFDYLDEPGKPVLEAMLGIYGGLLDQIQRRGYDVFSRRIELGRVRKFWLASRAMARYRWRTIWGR